MDEWSSSSTATSTSLSSDDRARRKSAALPLRKTYRFELDLGAENNVFNFLTLVANEEEKSKDADAAEQPEAKSLSDIRARRKMDSYADLGRGYDSSDPFIDDSEQCDDVRVPENVTAKHGGFYVNAGPLEFRVLESEGFETKKTRRTKKTLWSGTLSEAVAVSEKPRRTRLQRLTSGSLSEASEGENCDREKKRKKTFRLGTPSKAVLTGPRAEKRANKRSAEKQQSVEAPAAHPKKLNPYVLLERMPMPLQ
jgi:hypothetical protein